MALFSLSFLLYGSAACCMEGKKIFSNNLQPHCILYICNIDSKNMKNILQPILLVFMLVFAMAAGAQNQAVAGNVNAVLSGTVTDAKTGAPVQGASVYLPDIKAGAHTNAAGRYAIHNLPEGRFLIEISSIGYNSITEVITVKGDMTRDYKMDEAVTENETVTVTGVPVATRAKEAPVQVTLLKKRDVLMAGGTNLIDGLAKLGGVAQVSTGPAISKPVIHGLGYNRVVTVNDGVRQEGNQWGDEHGIEIDGYNVEKVEILRGPASLMYGSDALAGVINIMSTAPLAAGNIRGRLQADVQGNNRLFGYHGDVAGTGYDGFNWRFFGSSKVASDYKNAAVFGTANSAKTTGAVTWV
jgi:iron complex outermembrane recepter protein